MDSDSERDRYHSRIYSRHVDLINTETIAY